MADQSETGRFIDTPSGRIHYHDVGEGRPVVFLHGSGPGATGWSNFGQNIEVLSAQYRCLAIDMPGWGKSEAVQKDQLVHHQTVIEVLDALEIDNSAFVGNSMGGATCLKVASVFPERVSHLVTMGAGSGSPTLFGPGDGPTEGIKVLQDAYRNPSIDSMVRLAEIMTFDPRNATRELAQARLENALEQPEHLENFVRGIGKPRLHRATVDELRSIEAPTLVIHGRDDRVVHFEHGLHLVGLVPNSRLVLLNRCGHWVQVEHAEEFNRLVSMHLS